MALSIDLCSTGTTAWQPTANYNLSHNIDTLRFLVIGFSKMIGVLGPDSSL